MSEDKSTPLMASSGIVPTTGDVGAVASTTSATNPMAVTANGAAETLQHTSALNSLDHYFYSHFIRFTSFSWSTSMTQGHVIYRLPIEPRLMWPNLAWVMQMYNTWVGSFQFKIDIAGTGFNGGKLLVVRIPPNMDPDSFNVNDATVLNSLYLDVKMQESAVLECEDYRTTLFHYAQDFSSSEFGKVQNLAGYFQIMVMLPLVTSSTGNNSVNVQVSGRLGMDFVPGQMIPPTVRKDVPVLPTSFLRFDRVNHYDVDDRMMPLKRLAITGKADTTYGRASLRQFNGEHSYNNWTNGTSASYIRHEDFTTINGYYESVIKDTTTAFGLDAAHISLVPKAYLLTEELMFALTTAVEAKASILEYDISAIQPILNLASDVTADAGPGFVGVDYNNTVTVNDIVFNYTIANTQQGDVVGSINGETIVGFCNKSDAELFDLSTTHISDSMKTGLFANYNESTTFVFQLMDSYTNRPLIFLRLWHDGLWTTNKATSITYYRLDNTYLRLFGLLDVNSDLPVLQAEMVTSNEHYQFKQMITDFVKK